MGVDIHMFLINKKTKEIVIDNVFEGRNREWFDNISGRWNDPRYDKLERLTKYHWDEEFIPEETLNEYPSDDYYGYCQIELKDYMDWFYDSKPFLHAGWARTYDAWLYETSKVPLDEGDIYQYLPDETNTNDWRWVEYTDEYDSNFQIIRKVKEKISSFRYDDYILIYCFDC